MSDGFYILMGAFLASVVGPIVLAGFTSYQRKQEQQELRQQAKLDRLEDLERQAMVAQKVEEVRLSAQRVAGNVDAVAKEARAVASRVEQVASEAKVNAEKQGVQLNAIHVLADGNLTAAKQGELNSLKMNLILLKRLAKEEPSPDDAGAIAAAEARIEALETEIEIRLRVEKSQIGGEPEDLPPNV